MEYVMLYLGVCSVLFVFTIYKIKIEEGFVTVSTLLQAFALSYVPFVNLLFIWVILSSDEFLNKKVF